MAGTARKKVGEGGGWNGVCDDGKKAETAEVREAGNNGDGSQINEGDVRRRRRWWWWWGGGGVDGIREKRCSWLLNKAEF